MKQFLSALILVLSSSAYADYFGCDLRVNNEAAGEEAPYRGREVRVELNNYLCEAVIDQNVIVTTKVTNLLSGSYAQAGGRASAAVQMESYNPGTNAHDEVFCKCNLR